MTEHSIIREELVLACRRAYSRGIQTGSGGNVSARILGKDRMIVKASGGSFGDARADSFVVTDFDGALLEGTGKPTREALLHGYLYRVCPWANAVVHVHSPYAIALASRKKPLAFSTWHSRLKLPGDEIPVLDIPSPVVRPEDFPLVGALYEKTPDLQAFLLVDHGVVALAGDAVNAEHTAELVEETAQVAYFKAVLDRLGV